MGLRERTAANLGWTAASQALSVGLSTVVLIILASILSPNDFGIYAACNIVVTLSIQVTTMGLDYAVINSKNKWSTVVSTAGLLRLGLSGLAFVMIVLLSGPLSHFFNIQNLETPMIVISTSLIILAIAFAPQIELTKNLRFKELSIARVASSVTWSGLSLTLAVLHSSFWSLIVAFVAAQALSALVMYFFSRQRLVIHDYDGIARNQLLRFGGITALGGLVASIQASADKIIVGSVNGSASLGIYYAMSVYGITAPSWLTGIINTVMFPTYSMLTERPMALRKAYADSLRFVSEFAAPVSLGLAGTSGLFISILLGDQWTDGIMSLSLLSIAGFFMAMTSPAANVFISLGRPELIYQITLAVLVPEILVATLAASQLGMTGVAATVMVFECVKFLYVVHKAAKLTGMDRRETANEIIPYLASGAVVGAMTLVISQVWGESLPTLVLAIVAGAVIYLALGLVLSRGKLRDDIREILALLRNKQTVPRT